MLIADDHPGYLDALDRAVNARPDQEVLGAAADGAQALAQLRALAPTVAVLDQALPTLSGLEILDVIGREGLATRTMILSADGSGTLAYEAVQLGAAGVLSKVSTLQTICNAIATIAAGGNVIGQEVQAGLMQEMRVRAQPGRVLLTPREIQVLQLVAAGASAPEIAVQLFVTPATVRTHLKNTFEKLGVNDRASAVAEGMRRGLLD